jgi:hypothetical protein
LQVNCEKVNVPEEVLKGLDGAGLRFTGRLKEREMRDTGCLAERVALCLATEIIDVRTVPLRVYLLDSSSVLEVGMSSCGGRGARKW